MKLTPHAVNKCVIPAFCLFTVNLSSSFTQTWWYLVFSLKQICVKKAKITKKSLIFFCIIVYCHYKRQKGKKKSSCWLTGNVGDHGEDEEAVVIEREVVLVGESDGVKACLLHVRQRCIDRQQFPSHSHRIQHDEEGVPAAERFEAGERNKKKNKTNIYINHCYCNQSGGW